MRKLIHHIFLIFTLTVVFNSLFAQDDDYSRLKDKPIQPKEEKKGKSSDKKFVYGGGLGLQLGNPTLIEISPKIAYKLTEKALLGAGVSYVYFSGDIGPQNKIKTSIYGGSLFASYEPIENIFAWAEYEMINFQYYNINSLDYARKWVGSPFVGAGYRQPIGEKGFMQILLLYNLDYTSDSPYSSPFMQRISFFL